LVVLYEAYHDARSLERKEHKNVSLLTAAYLDILHMQKHFTLSMTTNPKLIHASCLCFQ